MQKLKKTSYILCVTVLSFCKTKTRRGLQIIIHNCPKKMYQIWEQKHIFFVLVLPSPLVNIRAMYLVDHHDNYFQQ